MPADKMTVDEMACHRLKHSVQPSLLLVLNSVAMNGVEIFFRNFVNKSWIGETVTDREKRERER